LNNSDLKNMFAVVMMFLGFNYDVRFNESFLEEHKLDDFLRIPLVKERAEHQNDMEFSTYL